jgi:hypothetical protein
MLNDQASVSPGPTRVRDPRDLRSVGQRAVALLTRPRSLLLDAWHRRRLAAAASRFTSGRTCWQRSLYLMVLRVRWTASALPRDWRPAP